MNETEIVGYAKNALAADNPITLACLEAYKKNCPAVQTLLENKLVFPSFGSVAKMRIERQSKETPVVDEPEFVVKSIPLPVISTDFNDISEAADAGRIVGSKVDNILFRGLISEEGTIEGLCTARGGIKLRTPAKDFDKRETAESILRGFKRHSTLLDLKSLELLEEETVFVEASKTTIQMIVALEPIVIAHEGHYRFATITIPRVREDYLGFTGVVYFSKWGD